LTAAVVRLTGVLLIGLSMIAGQLGGAVLLDLLAPGAAGRPGAATIAGLFLTLIAVAIAALPRRRVSGRLP
jgi:transporter family-2 protein